MCLSYLDRHRDSDLRGCNSFFSELAVESIIGLFAFPSRSGLDTFPSSASLCFSTRSTSASSMTREYSAPSALRGFRVSFSLFRSRTPLALSHERSATVLLMMREEHHPPIKRARVEHGGGMAGSSLPTFPLRFFLPRYLRLPDICTRHAAEARPSHVREREKVGTLICRAFCARENARRVLIAA